MINCLTEECHAYAQQQGFWEDLEPSDITVRLAKLMLIVTEAAEAAEGARIHDEQNWGEELADICIRVFDLAGATGVDLEREIHEKMLKNQKRIYMHGKSA